MDRTTSSPPPLALLSSLFFPPAPVRSTTPLLLQTRHSSRASPGLTRCLSSIPSPLQIPNPNPLLDELPPKSFAAPRPIVAYPIFSGGIFYPNGYPGAFHPGPVANIGSLDQQPHCGQYPVNKDEGNEGGQWEGDESVRDADGDDEMTSAGHPEVGSSKSFPMKLYDMLTNTAIPGVYGWSQDGTRFWISAKDAFMDQASLLGVCDSKDFGSFVRQLGYYEFKPVGKASSKGTRKGGAQLPLEFIHPEFNRRNPGLVAKIKRKRGARAEIQDTRDQVPAQVSLLSQLQIMVTTMRHDHAALRREFHDLQGKLSSLQQSQEALCRELRNTKEQSKALQEEQGRMIAKLKLHCLHGVDAPLSEQSQGDGYVAGAINSLNSNVGSLPAYSMAANLMSSPTSTAHTSHYGSTSTVTSHPDTPSSDFPATHTFWPDTSMVIEFAAQATLPQMERCTTSVQRTPSYTSVAEPSHSHPSSSTRRQEQSGDRFGSPSNVTSRMDGIDIVPSALGGRGSSPNSFFRGFNMR